MIFNDCDEDIRSHVVLAALEQRSGRYGCNACIMITGMTSTSKLHTSDVATAAGNQKLKQSVIHLIRSAQVAGMAVAGMWS